MKPDAEEREMGRGYRMMIWRCVDSLYALHSLLHPVPNLSLSLGVSQPPHLATDPAAVRATWGSRMRELMAETVYGSNYIERVGASLDITRGLCVRI